MRTTRSLIMNVAFVGMLMLPGAASAGSKSDALENLTAVMAAQHVCGYSVDQTTLAITIRSLFGDPNSVAPGGRHWSEIERNMARIKSLTATSSGQASFCSRVRSQQSAFFN